MPPTETAAAKSGSDPFAEGVEAAHSGQSDTANPYEPGTDDNLSWNDGYNSASEADPDDLGQEADQEVDDRAEAPPAPGPADEFMAEAIRRAHHRAELRAEFSRKDKAAKAAKKALELAEEEDERWELSFGESYPLFDQAERRKADPVVVSDPAPAPEAWRGWSVQDLGQFGLSTAIQAKLYEAGITTVGAIADHTSAGKPLTEIPGVGPAKADQIDEALAKFWAAQPPADATPPPAPGPPTAPDAEGGAPDEVDRRPKGGPVNDLLAEHFGDAEDEQWSPPEPDPSHTPLERLEIDPRHLVKLAAAGITTVESMLDYVANVGHISEIVGKKGGRAIDEAVDRWASAGPAAIETDVETLLAAESDADAATERARTLYRKGILGDGKPADPPPDPADGLFAVFAGQGSSRTVYGVRAPSLVAATSYAKAKHRECKVEPVRDEATRRTIVVLATVDRAGAVVATPDEPLVTATEQVDVAGQTFNVMTTKNGDRVAGLAANQPKPKRARKAKAVAP